ncbi:MAG: beta strand repeat-containing protein, partial [Opitutales bacterium]
VHASDITVSGNVTTSLANAAVVLKASGSVTQNASTTVQTNGGDIVFWADSGGVGSGNRGILISDSSLLDSRTSADRTAATHTTGGGMIVLGGGSTTATSVKGTTIPTGYALNYTSVPAGLMIGSYNGAVGHNANVRMFSGGGDVVWRGRSTQNVANLTIGISAFEGVTVNAGTTGDITLDGVAVGNTTAAGMDIHGWRAGTASSSYLTVDGDILFTSSGTGATNNVGTQLGSSAGFPIIVAATGAGTVTIKGLTSGTASDVNITDVQLLSGSGSVSVIVDRAGGKFSQGATASAKFGQAASSPVTASSASVLLRADVFDVTSTNGLAINTTGSVEITSFNATGFTAASSFSRLDVGRAVSSAANSISSFTFGKTTNNAAVTVTAGGVNALGPIRFYGSNLTVGAPLRTDAASAEILLQGTGFVQTAANLTTTGTASPIRLLAGNYVNIAAASTWTTSGSNVLVAANTDATGGGYIYATGNQSIVTSGGSVTFAGGDAVGSDYAEGISAGNPEGIRFYNNLTINTSVTVNGVPSGGDIILRGRSFTSANGGLGAWGAGVDGTTTFDSGTGTIRIDGISRVSSGDSYSMGVRLYGNVTATSASTSATAIHITGTGGAAASSYYGGQAIRLEGTGNLLTTTGLGGGIKLSGTPGSQVWAVVIHGGSVLSSSGPIELSGTTSTSRLYLDATPTLGFKAGTSVTSSSANILLSFHDASWGSGSSPVIATSGSFTFQPSGAAFNRAVYSSWFALPTTLSGLTIGSATNTSLIYLNTALTVQGPVTVQGGYVEVTQPISAAGDILLDADTGATISQSIHGIYSNSPISTTAASNGNITLIGRGGWAGANYGIYLEPAAHVTAGGSGSIALTGQGGINTGNSNYGIYLPSNLTAGAGNITVTANGGGSGASTDNDAFRMGSGSVIRTTTGDVLIVANSGIGANSESLVFLTSGGAVTLGHAGQSGDITLRGNWVYTETNNINVLGTGAFTLEPTGASFTTAVNLLRFAEAATLTGYTVGKSGNTGGITVDTPVSVAGPISLTGGAVALNSGLATTSGNVSLTTSTLTGAGGISLPSGATLTITQSGDSTFGGVISGDAAFTKAGVGTLSLSANSTFTGATTISAGGLALGGGGTSGWLSGTSAIAVDGTLQIWRSDDVTIALPLSGAGTLEVKGAYRATFSSNLTTTAQTIATNMTVAEVVRRLAGGMLNGTAIVGAGTVREAGAYQVNFDPVANVATFQLQHYDTAYTKTVFVRLIQNGADVQALVHAASPHINGTAYIVPNLLGQDMATYAGVTYDMLLATSTGGNGYGVGRVDLTAKTTLASLGTFSGTLRLTSTTETGTGTNVYTKTIPGTLEITGGFGSVSSVVNNGLIILNDSTGVTLNTPISGTGAVFKKGAATTTFAQGVTYGGVTVVAAGGLTLQGTYGSASHTILSGATLTLDATGGDRDYAATTFRGTGTLAKTGAGRALWGTSAATFALGTGALIDVQGGIFTASSNSNEVWTSNLSDLNVASGARFAVVEGNARVDALTGAGDITVGFTGGIGSLTLGVDNHTASSFSTAGSATFSGVIADTGASAIGAVIKDGTGTQILSGVNTYAGATTVSAGTLAITDAAGLGTTAAGTTVASGATLDLRGITVGAEALTLNGGTLLVSTGTSSLSGAVTLGASSTLNVTGTQLTLGGIISGTNFGLTKGGAGVAILTGVNTFTGDIAVNAGTLRIGGAGRLAAGTYVGALTVASGATFDFVSSANQIFGTSVSSGNVTNDTTNTLRGAGAFVFDGTGAVTLRGDFSTTGTVAVGQALTMTGGTNNPKSGLGRTSAVEVLDGGTITLGGVANSFIGYSVTSALTLRAGGKLTTDGTAGQTFHLGVINLDGGELATGAGATITNWGIFNLDSTITVTADSTLSAQFSSMWQSGGTVF